MTQSLTPLIFNLGPTELIIILVIVLLLFGGSRLAGLGKSSGRALKEFKEETRGLRDDKGTDVPPAPQAYPPQQVTNGQAPAQYPTNGQAPAQYPTNGQAPAQYPTNGQAPAQYPTNGQAAPNSYPPVPQQNLNDPSATDVRKDV